MTQSGKNAAQIVGAYLTRQVTPEQINARTRDGGDFRHIGEVRQIDRESRTVDLAFSSETPVSRWFGEEVLDHSEGSIRLGRLRDGAALLVNHDWDDHVGVVESIEIGADRRGRAKVRFSRSARGEEVFADVVDGVKRHVSFGYAVHAIEVEKRAGQADLIRVTDWEPFEISLVSVPADPTVGVGRSHENAPEEPKQPATQPVANRAAPGNIASEASTMNKKLHRNARGQLVWVEVGEDGTLGRELEVVEEAGAERGQGEAAERARVSTIMELGRQYDAAELATTAVRDGRSIDQFRAAVLEQLATSRRANLTEGGGDIGMTDREVRRFSFVRLIDALSAPTERSLQEAAAFEFECARAAAATAHRTPKGVLVPTDVLTRAMNTGTGGGGAGDTGGVLVDTTLLSQSFVDMLRNRTTLLQLGTAMGGLVGNIDIPTQTGGASGYWIGEDEEAVLSHMSFGLFGMRPKTVAGMTEVTRRLTNQSALDIEALMRRDLAAALAMTIDKAGYYGSGSDHVPRGITRVAGLNAVDFGTDGAGAGTGQMPSWADIVGMETEIAADNADVGSMSYVFNARMRGHFKTTPKFPSGTDQGVIWEPGGTLNGYRTSVTNQINNGDVIFGNFSDLLIGMWGGLDVQVDPYTHSSRGRIRVVMMQDIDIAVRRAESFCLGRDISA